MAPLGSKGRCGACAWTAVTALGKHPLAGWAFCYVLSPDPVSRLTAAERVVAGVTGTSEEGEWLHDGDQGSAPEPEVLANCSFGSGRTASTTSSSVVRVARHSRPEIAAL